VEPDRRQGDGKRLDPTRSIPLPGLLDARRRVALSQRELAKLAGVSANTVRLLEGGRRGSHPATARKLASALGVSPEELVRGRRRE
jgi:transcriptional regulator with XRE-family HTH domain